MKDKQPPEDTLKMLFKALRLPTFGAHYQEAAQWGEEQGWSLTQYLGYLAELEVEDRRQRRIERLRKKSKLASEKTMASFDLTRLPNKVRRQVPPLLEGRLPERRLAAENVRHPPARAGKPSLGAGPAPVERHLRQRPGRAVPGY